MTLLAAPTASLAGGLQVVARSVETALHKLAELKFDLTRLVSAHGTAPLPPVAANDLDAIGRTNDAILYGARVVLCVTGDDASLESIGPQVPSSSSRDHGEPFATHLRALQSRLLCRGPAPVQPGRGRVPEHRDGPGPRLRTDRARRADPLLRLLNGPSRSIPAPDGGSVESMKSLSPWSPGFGWHVADLHRAADRLDVALQAVPFPESRRRSAWTGRGPLSEPAGSTC